MTPDPIADEVVPLVEDIAPDAEANNVSVDAYNDEDVATVVDIENQQPKDQCSVIQDSDKAVETGGAVDAPTDTSILNTQDAPADNSILNMDNTINDSMTSENCKIINESDSTPQQHTPCPISPGELADMNGSHQNLMIPDTPNLTPVKLDADLLKHEQETVTSSPTNSRDQHMSVDDSKDEPGDDLPLSHRQQRMRVLKCYGLVAIVVLLCAIGIPLGAVMLFKNKNEEASFENNSVVSEGNNVMPPDTTNGAVNVVDVTEAPVVVEAVPETLDPVVAVPVPQPEDNAVVEDEFVVTEEDNEESDIAAEPWDVVFDAPDVNITLEEKNVTTEETFPEDDVEEEEPVEEVAETEGPTEPIEEEAVVAVTKAPTESPSASPVTGAPTAPPTVRVTGAPTVRATRPPGPDRSDIYFELVNVTSPAVLQDTSSAQALAFLWLVEQDQLLPVPTGPKLLQRYSMVLLDHALNDPIRPVVSQAALDECEWTGVVCDEETAEVVQINWEGQQMNGQLVEELRYLGRLERLDLSNNELVGNLDYMYEVKSLTELFLNNNKFTGTLSEQVGLLNKLDKLYLGHNELEGNIPISLRSSVENPKPLRKCCHLFIGLFFCACCFSVFSDTQHLILVSFISGWLVLSHNKFSGYLPPDWRMRELFYLDLGYNFLSGPLPNDWDRNMVRLRHLYLDHNSFSGNVPGYFSQLGNGRIKQISVNSNFLEGEVPFNWDTKDQIIALNFQDNNITTPLDPAVCELSTFEQGVMVEMRVDCPICTCDTLCHMCG